MHLVLADNFARAAAATACGNRFVSGVMPQSLRFSPRL
jgi:hypothetical protein